MAKKYSIGRGKIYVSRFKTGTQTPEGFRFVGNVPSLTLTVESEKLDHYASTEGIRVKDESIVLQVNRTGAMTMEEIDVDNLALFYYGSKSVITQTSQTAQSYTIVDAIGGYMYQVGATTNNPTGLRKLSAVSVQVASATKTLGTDYTIDLERGLITILADGTINDGDDVVVTYSCAAASRDQVISGTDQVEGALLFISTNPLDTVKNDIMLPYVKFSANGDHALITEEWANLPCSLEILEPDDGRAAIYIDGQAQTA